MPAIREAIEGVDLRPAPSPIDTTELAARVDRAWRLWHTSVTPRADAGAMLPELIRDGRRALHTMEGQERRDDAAAALAGAYALAEQVLAWVADVPLLWLAADRCMAAAEIADDPIFAPACGSNCPAHTRSNGTGSAVSAHSASEPGSARSRCGPTRWRGPSPRSW